MNRRDIVLALAALGTSPLLCNAQQTTVPKVGLLGSESPDLWASRMRAYHQGLSEMGYVDGRNVTIDYRWAEGHNDRLPALAAELVRRQHSCGPGSKGRHCHHSGRLRGSC